MTFIDRPTLKAELPQLIDMIQKTHIMEDCVFQELYHNHTPVEGLCNTRGYFKIFKLANGKIIHLQYLMGHVIKNVELQLIGRAIESVTIYDDFLEYERERRKAMSAVSPTDQTGINYN